METYGAKERMWRSIDRVSMFGSSSRKLHSVWNYQNVIRNASANPHLSRQVFSNIPPSPNPRFFSFDSNLINHTDGDKEHHVGINTKGLLSDDENPSSSSSDSEQSLVGLEDENDSVVTAESEQSTARLDENSDVLVGEESVGNDLEDLEGHKINLEKLESVLSLLQSSVDGSLTSSLDNMDLTVNEEFLVRVLQTPHVPGNNLIVFYAWASRKLDFVPTIRVLNALVHAICSSLKKTEAYHLWDLMKEIGEKKEGILNTESLNELISLFSKLGKGKAGLEVFNKFEEFECVPNAETYFLTIEALSRRAMVDWAWSVCEKMLNVGSLPDSEKIGKIITFFCKVGKARDAHSVYLSAKGMNKCPPQSSINFLISSLCRKDETVKLGVEMLDDFEGEVRKYAIKPFLSVIVGLCRIKDVDEAKNLLNKMIDTGPPPSNAVFNLIINCLSKAGDMEEAVKMMKLMKTMGLKPDVYTYSVIMSGYAKGGMMDEACKVLSEAKKKHSKLSPVTYHILIRCYCKLENFDKALELITEMKDFGVTPNADEYNKLIQSLCLKALDWKRAQKLLEEMQENGLYLNGITKSLITAVKELEEEKVEPVAVSEA